MIIAISKELYVNDALLPVSLCMFIQVILLFLVVPPEKTF